jgi:hypothetical protein
MMDVELRVGGGRCEGKRERERKRAERGAETRGIYPTHQPPVTRFFNTLTLLQSVPCSPDISCSLRHNHTPLLLEVAIHVPSLCRGPWETEGAQAPRGTLVGMYW